jgi:hypothetical protein
MRTILSLFAAVSIVLLPGANAGAQVRLPATPLCLTFGQSTDLFEGETSPRRSLGGYFGLSMIEQTFDRAAYGSLVLNNGKYRIGMSKNTNTATISYQCDIATDSLVGQCNIIVYSAITSTSTLLTDVGTLQFGACAFDAPARGAGDTAYPLGEGG